MPNDTGLPRNHVYCVEWRSSCAWVSAFTLSDLVMNTLPMVWPPFGAKRCAPVQLSVRPLAPLQLAPVIAAYPSPTVVDGMLMTNLVTCQTRRTTLGTVLRTHSRACFALRCTHSRALRAFFWTHSRACRA